MHVFSSFNRKHLAFILRFSMESQLARLTRISLCIFKWTECFSFVEGSQFNRAWSLSYKHLNRNSN